MNDQWAGVEDIPEDPVPFDGRVRAVGVVSMNEVDHLVLGGCVRDVQRRGRNGRIGRGESIGGVRQRRTGSEIGIKVSGGAPHSKNLPHPSGVDQSAVRRAGPVRDGSFQEVPIGVQGVRAVLIHHGGEIHVETVALDVSGPEGPGGGFEEAQIEIVPAEGPVLRVEGDHRRHEGGVVLNDDPQDLREGLGESLCVVGGVILAVAVGGGITEKEGRLVFPRGQTESDGEGG